MGKTIARHISIALTTILSASILGVVTLLFLISAKSSSTHPAQGHKANSLDRKYAAGNSGRNPHWDFGDIVMTSMKLPPDELSEIERYMVAGTASSNLPGSPGLAPYKREIWTAAARYYAEHKEVPEQLTPRVLRSIPELSTASDEFLQIYRNPITGDWPRLKSRTHSAGDFFLKPLNQVEMRYYANLNPTYQAEWFRGEIASGTSAIEAGLAGKVWYVRMYGARGVLCEQFYTVIAKY